MGVWVCAWGGWGGEGMCVTVCGCVCMLCNVGVQVSPCVMWCHDGDMYATHPSGPMGNPDATPNVQLINLINKFFQEKICPTVHTHLIA